MDLKEITQKILSNQINEEEYKNLFIYLKNNPDKVKELPDFLQFWFQIQNSKISKEQKLSNYINKFENTKYSLFSKFFKFKNNISRFYKNLILNYNEILEMLKLSKSKERDLELELLYILKTLIKDNEKLFEILNDLEHPIVSDMQEDVFINYIDQIDSIFDINFKQYSNHIADFYATLFIINNIVFYCPEFDIVYYLNKDNLITFNQLEFEQLYTIVPSIDSFNNSLISFKRFRERFLHSIKYYAKKINKSQIKSAISEQFIVCKNKIIRYPDFEMWDFWLDYYYDNQLDFCIFIECLNAKYNSEYKFENFKLDSSKFLIDKFLNDLLLNDNLDSNLYLFLGGLFCQFIKNKLFLLIGAGANGKSVLINIINYLFNNLSIPLSLDQFERGNPEFILYKLFNKLIISGSETGKITENTLKILKLLFLSNEKISARRPYSSRSVEFIPNLIGIFAVNHIPFGFFDSAFERRLFILIFDKIIDKNKRIENLDI
ncbi:MAG: hypothetical protein ACTSQP_22420, partial [Promethearchaeota archaeon]